MESISKLQEIKQRRQSTRPGRILVGMGTCCMAAGANAVFEASTAELADRRLEGWEVIPTGCLGFCDQDPLMVVEKPGQPQVVYRKVTADKARHIVAKHVANDQIVSDWVLPAADPAIHRQE